MTRKLVAGYRNKRNAKPNAKHTDFTAETKETLKAVSAQSVMAVANRGQAWKEMIQKSLSAGISSLATLQFDGEFRVQGGNRPASFEDLLPKSPGVYVVYDDRSGKPVYVGDSENMYSRWNAGHLNEYQQGERPGHERYKLADAMQAGCTVKFIRMESKETAAALEAHLIGENFKNYDGVRKTSKKLTPAEEQARDDAHADGMLLNKRGELETKQGTRSNQEAKKIKDASGGTGSLLMGAGKQALANMGFDTFERLTTVIIKAVKDELVDICHGSKTKIAYRVERVLRKIWSALKGLRANLTQTLRGIVEFVVNALSHAIGQVYNLARNLFDLAHGAWDLWRGSKTMSTEELIQKISETVIISGSIVLWDALDPVIEAQLTVLGPFAPYVSSALVAIGFGLSTFAIQKVVTHVVKAIIAFKRGMLESLEAARAACDQTIRALEQELLMLSDLKAYAKESLQVMQHLKAHTDTLSKHQAIKPFDVTPLLPG